MSHKLPDPPADIQRQIAEDYRNGAWIRHLKARYPVGWNQIQPILAAHGVPLRHSNGKPLDQSAYPYDTGFFAEPTVRSCYWAGFILADGSVTPRKRSTQLRLAIASKDAPHLAQFCRDIGAAADAMKPEPRRGERWDPLVRVHIQHTTLGAQLARFGIGPGKTYRFAPPAIPTELLPHFLRGWADGDGYVRPTKQGEFFKISGNREGLRWFGEAIRQIGWTRSVHLYPSSRGKSTTLVLFSSPKAQTVAPLLLADTEPVLKRRWANAQWRR